jgi:hypothetical protein
VAFGFVESMRANDRPSFGLQCSCDGGFHFGLGWPAFLVGGEAEVAIRNEANVF